MTEEQAMRKFSFDQSEYALLLVPTANYTFYAPAKTVAWSNREAHLRLQPEDAKDEGFLRGLRPSSDAVVAGYEHYVGLGRIIENTFLLERGQKEFDLRLLVERSEFTSSFEMSLGSTSADEIAVLRARRLLLNENPSEESRDVNAITRELFLSGGPQALMRVERSPFPQLFKEFGDNPQRFLQIAWISAIVQLKLSACVVEVTRLQLTMRGTLLDVEFSGKRKKQFQNRPAYQIAIKGTCVLA